MVATVLCHYLDLNGPLCKSALQSLLGLLMNKYPKVAWLSPVQHAGNRGAACALRPPALLADHTRALFWQLLLQ